MSRLRPLRCWFGLDLKYFKEDWQSDILVDCLRAIRYNEEVLVRLRYLPTLQPIRQHIDVLFVINIFKNTPICFQVNFQVTFLQN